MVVGYCWEVGWLVVQSGREMQIWLVTIHHLREHGREVRTESSLEGVVNIVTEGSVLVITIDIEEERDLVREGRIVPTVPTSDRRVTPDGTITLFPGRPLPASRTEYAPLDTRTLSAESYRNDNRRYYPAPEYAPAYSATTPIDEGSVQYTLDQSHLSPDRQF